MRTLREIIEAAQSNAPLDTDETRYAVCALVALSNFDGMALNKLHAAQSENKKPFLTTSAVYQAEESHKRWQAALGKSPRDYCGSSYDPANPEYQKRRRLSRALWDKIINQPGKTS